MVIQLVTLYDTKYYQLLCNITSLLLSWSFLSQVLYTGINTIQQHNSVTGGNSNNNNKSTIYDQPLVRLTRDILSPHNYDHRVRPIWNHKQSLKIYITMSLYQIIEVVIVCFFDSYMFVKTQNEPAQNIKMNVWMIQVWMLINKTTDWLRNGTTSCSIGIRNNMEWSIRPYCPTRRCGCPVSE